MYVAKHLLKGLWYIMYAYLEAYLSNKYILGYNMPKLA